MIGDSKEAYDDFRKRLVHSDLAWARDLKASQSRDRHTYFRNYIEPLQRQQRVNREERARSQLDMYAPKSGGIENGRESPQAFIPLADLLKRSHKDRVQYHMQRLESEEDTSVTGTRQNERFKVDIREAQGLMSKGTLTG